MLDQVSDTELELRPRSTAQSGGVEGAIRHLTQEDLAAYATGRLASARLNYCQTHLDSCEECRTELEDLRTLKHDMSSSSSPRSEPIRHELGRRRQSRGLPLPLVASVVAILVGAGATAVWWTYGHPRTNGNSAAVAVAQTPNAPTTTGKPGAAASAPAVPAAVTTRAAPIAPAPLTTPATPGASPALTTRAAPVASPALTTRAAPVASPARAIPTPSAARANPGFALLGPFGDAISETRPVFSWQPLPGAIGYTVRIVDAGLHPVQHSPALRATSWRPRRPLHRGKTYLWQVTATLRGGSKVVASSPSPAETLLRILP